MSPVALINPLIVSMIQLLPGNVVKRFAMRYIAGETLEDALRVVRSLNSRKMMGTLDVLGENVTTREEALFAAGECEKVLHDIQQQQLDANLSIKLTQFGLKIDRNFCFQNVKRLLGIAEGYGNFVRIDMEDSSTTSATLEIYERLRADGFSNTGIVIQAYLRRSEQDVRHLIELKANVRLCKGIYVESEAIAFKDREEIRRNYLVLLRMLLDAGRYVGIATHDEFLVRSAYSMIRDKGLKRSDYEFQMLYGVRPGLRDRIVSDGHRLRVYVPFGKQWYSYSIRRFKENPQIARYVFGALFSRG
jgi:proline dehydrogenase